MRMLIVDALALALYLVVSLPALTGIGLHEWLGLGVGLALLVHSAQHIDFVGRLLSGRRSLRAMGRVLLDAALVVAVVATKAIAIVSNTPVIATIRFPMLPSGSIIAGNSKMPIPPIMNLRKLNAP